MAGTPEQLAMPTGAEAADHAVEVLRAWIIDNRQHISLRPTFDDPAAWGMFFVDISRHVARAYASEGRFSEEDALRRIAESWTAELARPTNGTTERIGDES